MTTSQKNNSDFKIAAKIGALISKDYAREFFRLLVVYRDISASEAATRLNIHIKTAQDFLEGMEAAGIVSKREAAGEKKRPYFRYSLSQHNIQINLDLNTFYNPDKESIQRTWKIKERLNSGALFKESRDDRISAVHVFEGEGRSREEKRFNLTECQGKFLFHLPFPTQQASRIDIICAEAGVKKECLPEILDIVNVLISHGVIEKF